MKRLLLAMLLCAACKHSTSSSSTSHTETSTVTDSTSSETGATTTTTTVQTEPGETVTTIDEYAPPVDMLEPISPDPTLTPHGADGGHAPPDGVSGSLSAGHSSTAKVPRRGPLVKHTVIDAKHGATTAKTAQEASTQAAGASETRAAAKGDTTARAASESKPAASCVSLGWLCGLILLAVAFVAWRLLKP